MSAVLPSPPPARPLPLRPGWFARLAQTLVSPAFLEFWGTHFNPAWSLHRPRARIVGRRQESHDAVTLLLAPNRHWRGFQPGQHLSLSAEVDGSWTTRSYSLSDVPRADGRLAVTVRHVPGGRLSTHLCHHARVGEVVELGPAFGEMTLPASPTSRWLFLAAGSGITPLMAMVRALAAQGMPAPLSLVYAARTRADLCFVEELRALASTHPAFNVHFALSREAACARDESSGRIDADLLANRVPGLAQCEVFACGPGGFVAHARELLAGQVRSFQCEAFTPPPRVVEEGGHVQLTLAASGRTLTVPRGVPLLDALEAEGLKPAHGCRMGICNTCACGKRSGTTRQLHTGDVQHEPVSALRLCVHGAASDLVLDL